MAGASRRKLIGPLLLGAALALGPPPPSHATNPWLPLDRTTLTRILGEASDGAPPATQSLDDIYAERRKAVAGNPEALARLQKRYEADTNRLGSSTVWLLYGQNLPYWIAMSGDGEKVHSLKVSVPVVNHGKKESKAAFDALTQLFTTLYPDWPEATEWPGRSLAASWEASPLVRKTPLENPDEVFIRHSAQGITSTTYGVPPDIVVYEVTVRERCIPSLAQGNPFERAIC